MNLDMLAGKPNLRTAKLTEAEAWAILLRIKAGERVVDIHREFEKVRIRTLYDLSCGKKWRSLHERWRHLQANANR